jgi:chromate reductase, NAD(P)H dehydrogenase (quinone)
MMNSGRRILLVSGSLRHGSTNSALLRTAVTLAPAEAPAVLYGGMRSLPHFDPDDDHAPWPPAVTELRSALRAAHAILFCTPEYAGALPGSFKNLLDWTVGDDQPGSIYDKPVAWINASASPTGAADAHESLAKVLHYVHAAVVTEACVAIPVSRAMVGADGSIADAAARAAVAQVLAQLAAASDSPG